MSEMAKDAEAKPMSDEEYARKVQSDEDAKSAGATAASADAADEGPNIDLAAIGLGSNTKPKHAGEGAWRLLKSVGVGVAGGAAALVAAPALGAKEGGAKGFAQGLGKATYSRPGKVRAFCVMMIKDADRLVSPKPTMRPRYLEQSTTDFGSSVVLTITGC